MRVASWRFLQAASCGLIVQSASCYIKDANCEFGQKLQISTFLSQIAGIFWRASVKQGISTRVFYRSSNQNSKISINRRGALTQGFALKGEQSII